MNVIGGFFSNFIQLPPALYFVFFSDKEWLDIGNDLVNECLDDGILVRSDFALIDLEGCMVQVFIIDHSLRIGGLY